ncbi:hypothetical protein C2E23DRAFT_128851 [Lenzites betulinus]|nr:hypothetical protein C2E23DRAFT_128851 [Lenzites betulinus]
MGTSEHIPRRSAPRSLAPQWPLSYSTPAVTGQGTVGIEHTTYDWSLGPGHGSAMDDPARASTIIRDACVRLPSHPLASARFKRLLYIERCPALLRCRGRASRCYPLLQLDAGSCRFAHHTSMMSSAASCQCMCAPDLPRLLEISRSRHRLASYGACSAGRGYTAPGELYMAQFRTARRTHVSLQAYTPAIAPRCTIVNCDARCDHAALRRACLARGGLGSDIRICGISASSYEH